MGAGRPVLPGKKVVGQKQVPTSPPSCGACPVTLLATPPQDRLATSLPAGRAAGPGTEAPGPSQREASGCKQFALPPGSHVMSTLKEDLTTAPSAPRRCRRKPHPRVKTPQGWGCSAAGRVSSPTRCGPGERRGCCSCLLPPQHPEPGLCTFHDKYAS